MRDTIHLLEHLATDTWERLHLAEALDCPQSEATITDINLLYLLRSRTSSIRVYKARGRDEPERGFDWEWWVGSVHSGWWRYSVQAKKLDLRTDRYLHLRHQVGPKFQVELLEEFARAIDSCITNVLDYGVAEVVCDLTGPRRNWRLAGSERRSC